MSKIVWAPSYDAAIKSARASKKLIMIDFYADWCVYCKKLDAEVYTDKTVIQLTTQLVALKLDSDRAGHELAQKLGVRGLPTVVFIDADGGEWARLPGFAPAGPFAELVRNTLKDFRETPQQEARLKATPSDGALAAKLAQQFAQRGNRQKALWAIQLAERAGKAPTSALAAIGGMLLDSGHSAESQNWFTKALRAAKTSDDKAMARLGTALCYATKQDFKRARTEFLAILSLPGLSADRKTQIQGILEKIPK